MYSWSIAHTVCTSWASIDKLYVDQTLHIHHHTHQLCCLKFRSSIKFKVVRVAGTDNLGLSTSSPSVRISGLPAGLRRSSRQTDQLSYCRQAQRSTRWNTAVPPALMLAVIRGVIKVEKADQPVLQMRTAS